MNTANLQLEGLYLALIALQEQLKAKGVLSAREIDDMLDQAGQAIAGDSLMARRTPAQREAMLFPVTLLKWANTADDPMSGFSAMAREIGLRDD